MKEKIKNGLWILLAAVMFYCMAYVGYISVVKVSKSVEKTSKQAYDFAIEKAAKISKDLEEAKK